MKDKGDIIAVMVHLLQIKKSTTLPLHTDEDWRKFTSEDHDLGYIKSIISIPDETTINPKELRNSANVKPFQHGRLEMENYLISYYDTPLTARVRQLRLRGPRQVQTSGDVSMPHISIRRKQP